MKRRGYRAPNCCIAVRRAGRGAVEALEARLLLTAVWSGTGDGVNWTDPNNWFGQVLPAAGDDVIISSSTGATVKLASGTQSVYSVSTTLPLEIDGGALVVATTLQTSAQITLAGGTIQGAAIVAQSPGQAAPASASPQVVGAGGQLFATSGTLIGITLDCPADVAAQGQLTIQGGLTVDQTLTVESGFSGSTNLILDGGQTVGGTGQVVLGTSAVGAVVTLTRSGQTPLTIASGLTVSGTGVIDLGGGTLANFGDITADQPDQALTIFDGSLINQGTLQAAGGILDLSLDQGWSSSGSGKLDVEGGTLLLGGTFTTDGLNLSTFTYNGGDVLITGALDNSNSSLVLTVDTGSWILAGGTIAGGDLYFGDSASLIPQSGTLDGVTIDSDMTIPAYASLQVQDGLTLDATLTLDGNADGVALLSFVGTQTVSGTGQIALTGTDNNHVSIDSENAIVTLGPDLTLHGQGTIDGLADSALLNQGTILADVTGRTLAIDTPNFTNDGAASSANGGILSILSSVSIVVSGGNVEIGATTGPLSLVITGGNVTLGGALPVELSSLVLSGGALDGAAPVDLIGPASWTDGAINLSAPLSLAVDATLAVSGAGPHLLSGPFNNDGAVNLTGAMLQLNGGGLQTGAFSLAAAATLALGGSAPDTFAAGSNVSGPGTFAVQDATTVNIQGGYDVGATIVWAPSTLIVAPGAKVASIGSLTVNGGTFICGNPAGEVAPALVPAQTATPASGGGEGTVSVLTAAVMSGGTTLLEPGWVLSVGASGLTFIGSGSPLIELSSDPLTPAQLVLEGDVTFAGSDGTAAIQSIGAGAVPGQVDLGGTVRTFVVNDGAAEVDLSIASNIVNGSLHTSGPGRLQLASPGAFIGGLMIGGGTTEIGDGSALGSGPVIFAGGTLAFGTAAASVSNAFSAAPSDSISLDVGSQNVAVSALTLGSALNVTGSAGGSLIVNGPVVLQHDLTLNNSVPVTIDGPIGGAFGLTKTLGGTLTFSGVVGNTYSGPTAVNAGTLVLDESAGPAIAGNLTVNGPASVVLGASDQIAPTAALMLNSAIGPAAFDLAGHSQALASIASLLPASTIDLGTGTLAVGAGGASCSFGGTFSGTGTLVKQGAGTFTIGPAAAFSGAALDVQGGTVACAPSTPAATNTLRSLTISPGARLDLGNSTLTIAYGGGPDPASTVRSYLTSGYAGGAWSGPGLGTSRTGITLGMGDSADGIVAGLAANTLLIKPALPGDANLDGQVNFADLLDLAQHYGQTAATWARGDVNYDGAVNFADLLALAQHYGQATAAATFPTFADTAPRRVRLSSRGPVRF